MNLGIHTLSDDKKELVDSVFLGSDRSIFATTKQNVWTLYNVWPLQKAAEGAIPRSQARDAKSNVLVYQRTNIMYIATGNRVDIWDHKQRDIIAGIVFKPDELVLALNMEANWLAVVFRTKVLLYYVDSAPSKVGEYVTSDNPLGLCAISHRTLAIPGLQKSHIAVINLPSSRNKTRLSPIASIIPAHTSPLAALTVSRDGSSIASASSKGTLVRMFKSSGELLHEFRRGSDPAQIYSLAISPHNEALAVFSDKGTVHVWDIATKSAKSKPLLPAYFSSEWSHFKFRLPRNRVEWEDVGGTCVWFVVDGDMQLAVITRAGTYFRLSFDWKETEIDDRQCHLEEFRLYTNGEDDW